LNRRRGSVQRSKLGGIPNWGHSELGVQSGRKNHLACYNVTDTQQKLSDLKSDDL